MDGARAVSPTEIAASLDESLDAPRYRAEEPENGLVFDAGRPVRRLGAAVNTTLAAIDAAAEAAVDLLLVHHASWPYIDLRTHEPKMARLRERGISLYCAHASLDAAAGIGTGDVLARLLGITVDGRFAAYLGGQAGVHGAWHGTLDELTATVTSVLGAAPEVHRDADRCERVGIVTGAGSMTGWLQEALELGCDTYLTGEGSMYTRLFAKEAGLNLLLGGHYRTEAPGIRDLTERTAAHFGLDWCFIDDDPIG